MIRSSDTLTEILEKLLVSLPRNLVESYDKIRAKPTIGRDIDLICVRREQQRVAAIITELMSPEYALLNLIDNYYSLQLFYSNEHNKVVQIDLMDGVYKKHWQIQSAGEFFNPTKKNSNLVKTYKYFMSRVFQIRRFLNPPGRKVIVLGCDGAGKTTVINNLIGELSNKNLKVVYRYLFPGFFMRYRTKLGSLINIDPHGRSNYNLINGLIHEFVWLLEYVLGSFKDRYLLYQGFTIVYDRYIFDVVIDPKRYRLRTPILSKLVPIFWRSSVLIILHGNPEVLSKRKREISSESVASIQKRLFKLYGKFSGEKVLIDTTRETPERTIAKIVPITLGKK